MELRDLYMVEEIKMSNNYLGYAERMKTVTDLAVENRLSYSKVVEVYGRFNNKIYKEHGESRTYNFYLSEKAFGLTKIFLNLLN